MRGMPYRNLGGWLLGTVVGIAEIVALHPANAATSYFVDIRAGSEGDQGFWACGNPALAGPFASMETAAEWRQEFANDKQASLIMRDSASPGTCNDTPLLWKPGYGPFGWWRS